MSAPFMKSEQCQEHDNIATITGNRMVAFFCRYVQETPRQGHGNDTTGFFFSSYRGIVPVVLRLHLLQTQKNNTTTRFPVIVASY